MRGNTTLPAPYALPAPIARGVMAIKETPIPLRQNGNPLKVPETFDEFLELLRKILRIEEDKGIFQAIPNDTTQDAHDPKGTSAPRQFACPQATWFNLKVYDFRKAKGTQAELQGDAFNKIVHSHNPKFSREEREYVIERIVKEIQPQVTALPALSQNPKEVIYGDKAYPEKQIKYALQHDGKWLITAGKQVNAVIIDPAGKLIEITNGKITETGKGGVLTTDAARYEKKATPPSLPAPVSAQERDGCAAGCSHNHGDAEPEADKEDHVCSPGCSHTVSHARAEAVLGQARQAEIGS